MMSLFRYWYGKRFLIQLLRESKQFATLQVHEFWEKRCWRARVREGNSFIFEISLLWIFFTLIIRRKQATKPFPFFKITTKIQTSSLWAFLWTFRWGAPWARVISLLRSRPYVSPAPSSPHQVEGHSKRAWWDQTTLASVAETKFQN